MLLIWHAFVTCRKDVILPKTPATRRRKPMAAKRSRTLRSTGLRLSVDSGVEVDMMTVKSRGQLDRVIEKVDEEQVTTTKRSSQRFSRTTVEDSRQKMDENKENSEDNNQLTETQQTPVTSTALTPAETSKVHCVNVTVFFITNCLSNCIFLYRLSVQ